LSQVSRPDRSQDAENDVRVSTNVQNAVTALTVWRGHRTYNDTHDKANRVRVTGGHMAGWPIGGLGLEPTLSFDALIVGGGHNGLVTSGYLATAGLRVLVLER